MKKKIAVNKITQESYNRLLEEGFQVDFVQTSETPKVFSKYRYDKSVELSKFKKKRIEKGLKEKACSVPHVLKEKK